MRALFEITSTELLLVFAAAIVAIFGIVHLGRYLMKQRARKLTSNPIDTERSHSLRNRTKYAEVDVFKYTSTFMLAGLAVSLFLIVNLMNWTQHEQEVYIPEINMEIEQDVIVEPPRTTEPPPPPPPPPPPVIEEVPNEVILEEEDLEFLDQTIDAETYVEAPAPVETKTEEAAPPPPPPPPKENYEEIFRVVEEMPRFPGCEEVGNTIKDKTDCATQKLYEFIYSNIKYPVLARDNNIQGTAVVTFVVNTDGSIEQVQVLREPGGGCGEEAVRVIELMNKHNIKWTPGKQRGRPVRVQFVIPVRFALV